LLEVLKIIEGASHSRWRLAQLAIRGLLPSRINVKVASGLKRMGLDRAANFKEYFYGCLLIAAYARLDNNQIINEE